MHKDFVEPKSTSKLGLIVMIDPQFSNINGTSFQLHIETFLSSSPALEVSQRQMISHLLPPPKCK